MRTKELKLILKNGQEIKNRALEIKTSNKLLSKQQEDLFLKYNNKEISEQEAREINDEIERKATENKIKLLNLEKEFNENKILVACYLINLKK